MATKTFEELKQLAIQIRDEKTNKQNTATRVGTAMLEHINKLEQDYYDKTKTDEELKERDDKLTELENKVGVFHYNNGKYWGDNSSTGKIYTYAYESLVQIQQIKVSAGEEYIIKTKGIASGHPYFITKSDYSIVEDSGENNNFEEFHITIPDDGELLCINCSIDEINNFRLYNLGSKFAQEMLSLSNGIMKLDEIILINVVDLYYWTESEGKVTGGNYYKDLMRTEPIEVKKGDKFYIKASSTGIAKAYYIVDSAYNLLSSSDGIEFVGELEIQDDSAKYLLANSKNNVNNLSILKKGANNVYSLYEKTKEIDNNISSIIQKAGTPKIEIELNLVPGYVDYTNGTWGSYTGEGKFAGTQQYITINNSYKYITTCKGAASAGIAFYDENKSYISGYSETEGTIVIPENAKYFRLSNYSDTADHSQEKLYYYIAGEIDNSIESINKKIDEIEEEIFKKYIIINCTGDSVTEGMFTDGSHSSEYGKAPYPARLYTILKDNGYDNVEVNNYGHGGERLQDVAVRLGGIGCYINEDVIIPSDNTEVSLGAYSEDEHGRIIGTKLSLYNQDQFGDDYNVYLTQTSHDTNPCYIDGVEYTMSIHDNANWIKKTNPDGKETIITKGNLFFTANKRNPDVNIIYIGINGASSLNLKKWIEINKACAMVNGGKYIILGCTHALFNQWEDVEGSDVEEKHKYYIRICYEEFGIHFIDLYDEFSRHAMDIVLDAGFFSDKSEEDILRMRELLSNHTIPAEFSYDGNSEGSVHLSIEGYHVIGFLLYERLKQLNYI